MKKQTKPKDLVKIIKLIIYILLLAVGAYALINSKFTGFATVESSASVVTGSFLAVIFVFFIILLILLKIKAKPYKPNKRQ
jgi:amino acid transporter